MTSFGESSEPTLQGPGAWRRQTDKPIAVSGRGIWLSMSDGTVLLDGSSGTFNLPLGYNHPHVVTAVRRQAELLCHASADTVKPLFDALGQRLCSLAPGQISSSWIRDTSGSTANEGAIKIAQRATGKSDVVSLFLSHHGQTLATTAVSGNAFRRTSSPDASSPHSVKIPAPYCYRCFLGHAPRTCALACAEMLRHFVEYASSGSVAAVIVEPVLGNGGNIVPPEGYFAKLRGICDELGILIIADEVQTGLGRVGSMFASQLLGLEPDIITLAKGLGGIGVPIAAVLMREDLDVLRPFDHSFTGGSTMLGLAAAHATLDVLEQDGLLERVARAGRELGDRLKDLAKRHEHVGEVRGIGFMWGLELIDAAGGPDAGAVTAAIDAARYKHRLMLRGSRYGLGNVLKVRPALIATDDELEELVRRLDASLRASSSARVGAL